MEKCSKVLIVDDEPLNLDVLTRKLAFTGYDIVSASSDWYCYQQ